MKILTVDATLPCDHKLGKVKLAASQTRVTVQGRPVLVYNDPEGKPIEGCPSSVPIAGILPCTTTLPVFAGYSDLLTIEGRAVCLDTVTGFTTGTPPGTVTYTVARAGQGLVSEV